MHELLQSPAIQFVGRHNSGKTTIVCALVAELVQRRLDVATIKHHGHAGFDFDVPGKDSYRHRQAGASEVAIVSPDAVAMYKQVADQPTCGQVLAGMRGHDVVVVEGYRNEGLPSIEVLRAENPRDVEAAQQFVQEGLPSATVGVASNMADMLQLAQQNGLAAFELPAQNAQGEFESFIAQLATFVSQAYVREKVSVALQAGGESKRMGQSKALVEFCGQPLIVHMVRRLLPVADELLITTNEAQQLQFLHEAFPHAIIRLEPDVYEQRGALAGFVTALQKASHPLVATVACDMALASAELLAHEVATLDGRSEFDAVVPMNSHGFEPLHAVYRKETCLPAARTLVEAGSMRMRDLVEKLNVYTLGPAQVRAVVPWGSCFLNANTPEELQQLENAFLAGNVAVESSPNA